MNNLIEDKLSKYFQKKEEIYKLRDRTEYLEDKIKKIDKDIVVVKENIKFYKNISKTIEINNINIIRQLKEEIFKLEKEKSCTLKKILKINNNIRTIEEFTNYIYKELNNKLDEEDILFIELKYGDNESITTISRKLNIATATAYRKKEKVLEKLKAI